MKPVIGLIVPDFPRTGGYELQAALQARTLTRMGHAVRLLTNAQPARDLPPAYEGTTLHAIGRMPAWPRHPAGTVNGWLHYLAGPGADIGVLHAHALGEVAAAGAVAARLLGIPFVQKVASGDDFAAFAGQTMLQDRLIPRISGWFASAWQPVSTRLEAEVRAFGVHGLVRRIPNGVDIARFHPLAPEEGPAQAGHSRRHVTVWAGRMSAVKRLPLIIEAFVLVGARAPVPLALRLVGDGPERSAAAKLAGAHPDLDIQFAGQAGDVAPLLRDARAFVFASRSEGLPNAVIEAMASGLPVVAVAAPGVEDCVVDGETGWLASESTPTALAGLWLRAVQDPVRAAAMGAAGRRRAAAEFGIDAVCARVLALYRELGCRI